MKRIKPIALYLPQFHENYENNSWWGKGFTEWDNLHRSKPLFDGHSICKPHSDIGYYDLTNISIRRKQALLAKQYGVYGFCYYHYWSDGRVLLDKPLEYMLQDGEPDLPFMMSWANHDWTKKWEGNESEIMWKQDYNGFSDWDSHFDYLLRFFKNKNYIKVDNKPCLAIFLPKNIPDLGLCLSQWRKRAVAEGFDGLHIIGHSTGLNLEHYFERSDILDAHFLHQPVHTTHSNGLIVENEVFKTLDCIGLYKGIEEFVNPEELKEYTIYRGSCPGWDNSPRLRGEQKPTHKSWIMQNDSPRLFESHLKKLFMMLPEQEQLFFITAWNEWGEGSVLEPSDKYGYGYLEALKGALNSVQDTQ